MLWSSMACFRPTFFLIYASISSLVHLSAQAADGRAFIICFVNIPVAGFGDKSYNICSLSVSNCILCDMITAARVWQFISGHEWNYSCVLTPRGWKSTFSNYRREDLCRYFPLYWGKVAWWCLHFTWSKLSAACETHYQTVTVYLCLIRIL